MKKRIIIFGNGKLSEKFLKYIQPTDYVIGVDRAAYWLIGHDVTPHVAIGDFDSTSKKEWEIIEKSVPVVEKFSAEKNWTDMELAVDHAVKQKPTEVLIFGGTGTRLDHTMATWHTLDKFLVHKIPHILIDETNKIRLVGRGRTILARGGHRYVSILPYTKSITLTLKGFRYDLGKTNMSQGTTIGISNEIVGVNAIVEIFAGKTWVIESNDEAGSA